MTDDQRLGGAEHSRRDDDTRARARIESDLDTSFVVEAAAGTGKTTALVKRIVALIASGRARITELAAITFTERAAGELVLRLRESLQQALPETKDAAAHARIEAALLDFEAAHVGTIHGFCAELLRAHPIDAGVDPSFVVLGDTEQAALLEATATSFLEETLASRPDGDRLAARSAPVHGLRPLPHAASSASTPSGDGIRRFLRRKRSPDGTPRTVLAQSIRDLVDRRDSGSLGRRDPFERETEIDALVLQLRALVASDPGGSARTASWLRELDLREGVRGRDHDALERALIDLTDTRQSGLSSRAKSPSKPVLDALNRFARRANVDLAYCLARDLMPAVARYEATKARLGVLDHVDTLLRARALLAEKPRARAALSARFRFLFVDEVQDVDPVQKDVILLLSSEPANGVIDPASAKPRPGSLYLVGDPKQAIYGFRRADIRTYLALRDQLVPVYAERLELTASYRPRPAIAALVNATFEPLFDGKDAQAGHVPLVAKRPPLAGMPSVIALPSPRVYGERGPTKGAVESALPAAVGRFVAWLLRESGLHVHDPELEREVPIAPRHVALLFKALKGNAAPYAEALDAWRIPHGHVGADSFFDREAILAMSAVLNAIEWPDDELSVYAALKSPFLGITDADLLAYSTSAGKLRPLTKADDVPKELGLVVSALKLLRDLHASRHARSIEATLRKFLEATLAEVSLALDEDGGSEARALSQLVSLARAADGRGEGFRAFARWLAERIEDPALGTLDPSPDPESTDVVSILSVHKAKGLEFPVVILASPMTQPTFWKGPDRWSDPTRGVSVASVGGFRPIELEENLAAAEAYERGEATRVLYVAATRARDVLVVPTGGDTVLDGWTAPLQRALRPAANATPTTAPGLPDFGARSALDSIDDSMGVRPGHYEGVLEGVTFWDPVLLQVLPTPAATRNRTHLVEDAGTGDGSAEHAEFIAARKRAVEDAGVGRAETIAARRAARQPLGAMLVDGDVRLVELSAALDAPPSERLRALVSRLVSEAIADADLTLRAKADARMLGATEAEVSAACGVVRALRAHPELGPLTANARFGVPFSLASSTGQIVYGRAPMVVKSASGERVIGVALGVPSDADQVEVAIAAAAIGRATGEPTEAVLAWLP